jgi:hypothetical protein
MRRVMRWLQLHIEPHAAGKQWLHKAKQQVKRVEFFPQQVRDLARPPRHRGEGLNALIIAFKIMSRCNRLIAISTFEL